MLHFIPPSTSILKAPLQNDMLIHHRFDSFLQEDGRRQSQQQAADGSVIDKLIKTNKHDDAPIVSTYAQSQWLP
jgi:hypothetical protein